MITANWLKAKMGAADVITMDGVMTNFSWLAVEDGDKGLQAIFSTNKEYLCINHRALDNATINYTPEGESLYIKGRELVFYTLQRMPL